MKQQCISEEALQFFHDGELPAGDAAQVRSHLAECADCRSRMESLIVSDCWLTTLFNQDSQLLAMTAPLPLVSPVRQRSRSQLWLMAGFCLGVYLGYWLWQMVFALMGGPAVAWLSGSAGNAAITQIHSSLYSLTTTAITQLAWHPGLWGDLMGFVTLWCLAMSTVMLLWIYIRLRPQGRARAIQ